MLTQRLCDTIRHTLITAQGIGKEIKFGVGTESATTLQKIRETLSDERALARQAKKIGETVSATRHLLQRAEQAYVKGEQSWNGLECMARKVFNVLGSQPRSEGMVRVCNLTVDACDAIPAILHIWQGLNQQSKSLILRKAQEIAVSEIVDRMFYEEISTLKMPDIDEDLMIMESDLREAFGKIQLKREWQPGEHASNAKWANEQKEYDAERVCVVRNLKQIALNKIFGIV